MNQSKTAKFGIALLQGMPGTGMSGGECLVAKGTLDSVVICPQTGRWAAVPNTLISFVADPEKEPIEWTLV